MADPDPSSRGSGDGEHGPQREGAERGEPSREFGPGQLINGRYRVSRPIGQGGMGVVYQVSDRLHPDRPLALKAIRGEGVNEARLQLFKAEFAVMAQLHHPSIAQVYDFEPLHGSPDHFFTMEFVDGVDVYTHTEGMDWPDVLERWIQICRAMAYIHSRRVTHSDLKPSNVLVTADGRAQVLDFGLAGAHAGWIVGTPPFIAPETLARDVVDHRTDLYSLGVLAFVLFCRRLPHERTTDITELCSPPPGAFDWAPIVFGDRERRALPVWLVDLVQRLCARNPADRIQSANGIIEAVNNQGGQQFEVETAQTRESYLLSSRFVGRDEEQAMVLDHVEERLHPKPDRGTVAPLFLVSGDSGIGKSRLLVEIRRELQLSRTVVVSVDVFEGAPDELGPLSDALAHLVHLAEAMEQRSLVERYGPELVKLLPALTDEYDIAPSPSIGNPEAEQLRLADQVCEFLIQLALVTPFVLILNDLHWARPATTRVLLHLLRAIRVREATSQPVGLALLGSRRGDETQPPFEALLEASAHQQTHGELVLQPLDRANLRRLMGSMLGLGDLPPGFVDRVATETAGNPFFVEEIMRALVEQGAVYLEAGHWTTVGAVGDLDIPATIREAFQRRVQGLDDQTRGVLELLAVAGRPTGLMALTRACGLDASDLHGALSTLTERSMAGLVPGDEPGYGVTHDRLRETVYLQLNPERRRELHQTLGEALEHAQALAPNAHLYDLAYHFREAGDGTRALRYNLAAGERARQQYANALAAECFEHCWTLIHEQNTADHRLPDLEEKIGDALALQGRHDEAMDRYRSAARRITSHFGQARLLRKTGEVHIQSDELDKALDVLWEAVALLGHSRPQPGLADALITTGNLASHLVDRLVPGWVRPMTRGEERARAAELSTTYARICYVYHFVDPKGALIPNLRANRLAERLGPSEELSLSCSVIGLLYALTTLVGSAQHYCERALDMARSENALWHEAVARSRLGMLQYYRCRWDEAVEHLEAARALFLRCGDLFELGTCYIHIFACYINQGRYRLASEINQVMGDVLERSGQRNFLDRAWRQQASYTGAKLGEVADSEALASLRQIAQETEAARDFMAYGVIHLWIADLHRWRGELAQAADALEECIRSRESRSLRLDYDVASYPMLALTYLDQDREQSGGAGLADRVERRLRIGSLVRKAERLTRHRSPNYRALALLARAVFEWQHGRRHRAQRQFAASRDVARAQGAQAWLALSYVQEARCRLHGTPDPADRRRSIRLLTEAQHHYEECECPQELAVVAALLLEARKDAP